MAKKKINTAAIGGVLRLADDLKTSGTGQSKLDLVMEYAEGIGYDSENEKHVAGNAASADAGKAAVACVKFLQGKIGSGTLRKATGFAKTLKPKK